MMIFRFFIGSRRIEDAALMKYNELKRWQRRGGDQREKTRERRETIATGPTARRNCNGT